MALDLRLEAKGKTARGSQWEAPIFLRLTHLQEKSHGVWMDHDRCCPGTRQKRKGMQPTVEREEAPFMYKYEC